MAVGAVNTVDGFTDMATTARQSAECVSTSGYYYGVTGVETIKDEAYNVGAFSGWIYQMNVRISEPRELTGIPGDTVTVIVIDTGDPESMGIFISCITIGDGPRAKLVADALTTLRVDR